MLQTLDERIHTLRPYLELNQALLQQLFDERLPEINQILAIEGSRPQIPLGKTLESSSYMVKSILYHEYCVATDQPCLKQHRCFWLLLFSDCSASTAEQALRTALRAKHAVDASLDKATDIETINWHNIVTNGTSRVDRRFLTDDAFDQQITSQSNTCWGYIDGEGIHQDSCTTAVMRGNGNTEQGHQPEISQDLIVAQCRSCNRKQTIGDRRRGVYA